MKPMLRYVVLGSLLLFLCLNYMENDITPVRAAATQHATKHLRLCKSGNVSAFLSNGILAKTYAGVLVASINANGIIAGPHDGDVYSLVLQNFGNTFYSRQGIHIGDDISINYGTPWWNFGVVNISIFLKCTSNPHKNTPMLFNGSGCVD
jgi:hypothetical protein